MQKSYLAKQTQTQSDVWHPIPKDYQYSQNKVIFACEITKFGGKKTHQRYLAAQNDHLLLFKDSSLKQPTKLFQLVFTSKFEVTRDNPTLKGGKEFKSDKPLKADDIEKLGAMKSIKLSVEGVNTQYEFSAKEEALHKIREFLGRKINQLGFHSYFKVFKKIGKGNFASVYLAERIEDGRQMAIKAFSKNAVYSEENGKEGLINEIMIMRELNHPNVMKLYEVYETSNSLYMGLEMLEGGQLYEHLKKKVIFQNKEIQIILAGILKGLRHMHSKGIMHRDLKLENILFKKAKYQNNIQKLSSDISTVIIADFGLATFVNEPVYLYCRCGTPGFVAPEVINIHDMKATYDSVCDIYSLGLIFYILLTGKPAFNGRSYNTIVQQNKEAKVQFKLQVFDIVAPLAKELLIKMLEVDPKKRITADQCLQHDYLTPARTPIGTNPPEEEFEENIADDLDNNDLLNRINKINEESTKFDMLRINQLTNSPIKSPVMQATNKLKQINMEDTANKMVMRTPVLTGRIGSVEASPNQQESGQFASPFMHMQSQNKQQPGMSILSKYSKNQSQNPQQEQKEEQKDQGHQVKNVKNSLSKNV